MKLTRRGLFGLVVAAVVVPEKVEPVFNIRLTWGDGEAIQGGDQYFDADSVKHFAWVPLGDRRSSSNEA